MYVCLASTACCHRCWTCEVPVCSVRAVLGVRYQSAVLLRVLCLLFLLLCGSCYHVVFVFAYLRVIYCLRHVLLKFIFALHFISLLLTFKQ
jgi:hypothetical protein